jgi:hypothetical protein
MDDPIGRLLKAKNDPLKLKDGGTANKWVLSSCLDLAFRTVEEGSAFIIELDGSQGNSYYSRVFPTVRTAGGKALSVLIAKDLPVIKHLSELDGATIIDRNGRLKEFGVTLKKESTVLGHGKRHAFAAGTSRAKNVICIVTSEEDKHVRVFRDGLCLAEFDARTKVPMNLKHRVVDIVNNPLSRILVASGIATSILTLNPIPAIVTITGSSVIVSYGFDRLKQLF